VSSANKTPVNPLVTKKLRIAIVRFSALGDVVMVASAVNALKHCMPGAEITWITSPLAFSLLNGMEGITFNVMDKPQTLADYRNFYRTFNSQKFDVVLEMQANLRINLLYPALHAKFKIGFDRTRAREGQWLFSNRRIQFRDEHLVDSFLSFVSTLSGKPVSAIWGLPLSDSDKKWASERLSGLPRPLIAIHPHASKTERNWLPKRYQEVLERSVSRWNCGIILTGGSALEERSLCEQLAHCIPRNTLNFCGSSNLKQLAALLSQVDVLVAPDTGAVHIARALDTPVVGLYAVASPKLSGPYQRMQHCVDRYPQAVNLFLGKELSELPWNTRVHHPDAMSLIKVEEVMQQLVIVLEQSV
jgi:heptosyltransferase I